MAEQNKGYLFKILVVGCCGAGKTCCIRKAVFNQFTTDYKATIGVDFAAKTIKINHKGQEIQVCMQFWDIAGQEYYSQLSRAYYKGAYGCFLVCDLTSESLQQDIKIWLDEIQQKVFMPGTDNETIPTILLANKIDVPKAKDVWETASVQQELKSLGVCDRYATSAITGQGLDEAITALAKIIVEKAEKTKKQEDEHYVLPVDTETKDKKNQSQRGCC